ncbi:MAG: SDR family NAD(P)-dependent oxidoreductase, partial [Sedimentisphaerales bacterium]|nr:SDR family NAD(P)-dependent oxidoreductase [Sedimentisphaerales bacterium]
MNKTITLTEIAPIIRGMLAESTGNEDMPFAPARFRCDETSTAGAVALQIDNLPEDRGENDANLREFIRQEVEAYQKKHQVKPTEINIVGLVTMKQCSTSDQLGRPLKDKVALVSGAAGAIGYAVCVGLLEKGCHLVVSDLAGDRFDSFVADVQKIGGDRVIGVPIDVTNKESVTAGFQVIITQWGGVDIAVLNAGIALVGKIADLDLEAFRKLEKVNVEGILLMLAELTRLFTRQAIGGDIVIMSTKNVPSPSAGFGAYSATKAACHQLGRIASLELAPYGVRVNMVAPDAVFAEGNVKSGLWET